MKNFLKEKRKIILLSLLGLFLVLFAIYVIAGVTYKYPNTDFVIPKSLNPIFVSLGKLEIRWYAVCIIGGACLLSVYGYKRYLKPAGMDSDTILTGVTLGILFGILGGRLYYVAFNHDFVSFEDGVFQGIIDIINPANGGLAIHGSIYATIIFVFVYAKIKHLKFLELIEIVLPVFMLAQVAGRWGNFFNQEAYGPLVGKLLTSDSETSILSNEQLIWQHERLRHLLVPEFVVKNMYFFDSNPDSMYFGIQGYFHPTFFYEGVANTIGAISFIELRKYCKKIYVGDAIPFYLFWYGLVRFFIELLRQDPLTFTLFGQTFRIAVVTSILFMIVGVALFIIRRVCKFYLVPSNSVLWGQASIYKEGFEPKPEEKDKHEDELVDLSTNQENNQEEVELEENIEQTQENPENIENVEENDNDSAKIEN